MAVPTKNYQVILSGLKEKIRLSRQRAVVAVNNELLSVYWEIGDTILQQQKKEGWGAKVIDRLGIDLRTEFPDLKGLSDRNIKYMRAFAEAYPDFVQQAAAQMQTEENQAVIIMQQAAARLPWGHHQLILDKLKNGKERAFYISKAVENGWSRSVLLLQIESQLHTRQGSAITNFNLTLPKAQSDLARETLKSSYLFGFLGLEDEVQERELEKALMQHIKKFMLELGRGFAYVGNQYNLDVAGDDYFLDLLFYNYQLHCFVVFELKVGEFKPEFAGKLNFYINTVDEQIKGKNDAPTIGVLLCKTPNETVVKYALKGINSPIGVAEYELTNALPKKLKAEIPSVQEFEQELAKEIIEFAEKTNPVDARLKAIKEKLQAIKTEEIQTPVSYSALQKLYNEGLKPLYQEIIDRLSVFEQDFHKTSWGWSSHQFNANNFEQVDAFWNNGTVFNHTGPFNFFYDFSGFKKAGTESFGEHLELTLDIRDYWYGFYLVNHNNQQSFLKKLYHQPITKEDRQLVIDMMMGKVMDQIEWIIARITNTAPS